MQVTTRQNRFDRGDVWKGFAAGLVGGLVASWTMNRFQDLWSKVASSIETAPGEQYQEGSSDYAAAVREATQDSEAEVPDDTTVRTASAISEGLFHHRLTPGEKKIAGPAVHYVLGTGVGGLYGAAAEVAPNVTMGMGVPFGAAFWLVVDEGAVPLLGLSKAPTAYPLSTHVYALSSHFVYGITAELVRRALRNGI
jgi:hypothetical protein